MSTKGWAIQKLFSKVAQSCATFNKIDVEWAVQSRFKLEEVLSYLGALFGYPPKDHRLVSEEEHVAVEVNDHPVKPRAEAAKTKTRKRKP